MTGVILLNVGVIIGFWGVFWRLWDNQSMAPLALCGFGIVALLIGSALT